MAVKSHRDYFRDYHGITKPEMIVGVSAHAAVDKACDLMGIKLIKVPLDQTTYKIDLNALHAAIGPNTILMYASAPNYPQGIIDPVREMGEFAVKYNIGLHVDCCLGGFVLPFAKRMGYTVTGTTLLPCFSFLFLCFCVYPFSFSFSFSFSHHVHVCVYYFLVLFTISPFFSICFVSNHT
jgi:glutamate/tyrosine decarboxylase-like PLP-dependent enzyme